MSDIRVEREFNVTPQRLFEVVTTNAGLLQWWGHDGWTMRDQQLDFSRIGPWHSAMLSEEGNLFKMSGHVTKVEPVHTIGFTWGWHDADDQRGAESHVTFTIVESAKGAKLIIDHRELATDDIAAQHAKGWGGPLAKLERLLNS